MPHVLVVDDDEGVSSAMELVLTYLGHEVTLQHDGAAAVAFLRQNTDPVDLIILDHRMPGMSGVETLKAIRCILPEVKVIVATGDKNQEVEQLLEDDGIEAIIWKPYQAEAMIEMVDEILGG
ncbi:MAG: hypothetical protein DRQ37_04605 [Gammaproteobacteria bacterium]|nr:MAG: hypothetical protein DRQ37_04605 [Gammaproteobacteria bacterium]